MDLNLTNLVLFGNDFAISSSVEGDSLFSGSRLSLDHFDSRRATKTAGGIGDHQYEEDGCELILGIGPTPGFYCNAYSSMGVHHVPVETAGDDADPVMLKLTLSHEIEEPAAADDGKGSLDQPNFPQNSQSENSSASLVCDEGSTSARLSSGGYMPSLLLAPRSDACSIVSADSAAIADDSAMARNTGDSSSHQQRKCRFNGCQKGARDASGLCVAHGGGQKCLKPGCHKSAYSRTAFCKHHGGGKRCQQLGCTKSAEGRTEFCIAHGGGRRCSHPGCAKAARGKSGLCIRHGGGKRCTVENCTRSAEGQLGLCISHGGGRRCQRPGCPKGAQGSTMYCKAHGGGKRCIFDGCTKGAEGRTPLCKAHGGGKRCRFQGGGACPKSVHGGTDYCVAHGGGKRCVVAGCTKSARGRTDCCVRHGGGKRCKSEDCAKSAQGSTDFCKAHGGGKRCAWAHGCEKFARGKNGLCAAHGSMAMRRETAVMGRPRMMHNYYNIAARSSTSSIDEEHAYSTGLIPPQVLVPIPMRLPLPIPSNSAASASSSYRTFVIPEGRVHGGGLLSLLGGDIRNAVVD